jgi:hypothetical protein
MPDSTYPTFRRISHTPLRDVLRFRFTGRLDWKFRLAAANLPKPAVDLICRVVKRTRLWPLEKAAVADELIAHFADGVAAGSAAEQLMESFGDERVAAKLIRRAKRRGRPWPWHVWNVSVRVMAVVLAIYVVLIIRFCLGQPTISVDYLAKLNAPTIAVPQSDRAWPLWRQVILATSDGAKDGRLTFPEELFDDTSGKPVMARMVKWINEHASAIELARQAARKPALGFILGPGGSQEDPELLFSYGQVKGEPLLEVLLPHVNYIRAMCYLLSLDAKRAAEKGDNSIVEADITSMLGLARQLRESDGLVVTQEIAVGMNGLALGRIRSVLLNDPGLLKDEQLIRLAHAISGPRVAADLVSPISERYFFPDIVQRVYTDDGGGDGRMTLNGLRLLPMMSAIDSRRPADPLPEWPIYAAASTLPRMTASRVQVMALYDRLMDQNEANLRKPMREIDFNNLKSRLAAFFGNSPLERTRYAVLVDHAPSFSSLQWYCEQYLGERDGVVVGIALELYHRRHGHYPAALSELTPELLPEIPADRITGDLVKYRLSDAKPIVYSVGADRIDDGGSPSSVVDPKRRTGSVAAWGIDPKSAPRGDWLLFAPDSTDPEGN